MLQLYAVVITMLVLTEATPSSKSRQIKFVKNGNNQHYEISANKISPRYTRSFVGLDVDIELWTEPSLALMNPLFSNSIAFNYERNGHITPDFSNGLDYPDPLLLTGLAAKRAVSYLYSRELFFGDIPHVRAILRNQEQRRINGLSGNRLGSTRDESPFFRFKKQRRFQQFF